MTITGTVNWKAFGNQSVQDVTSVPSATNTLYAMGVSPGSAGGLADLTSNGDEMIQSGDLLVTDLSTDRVYDVRLEVRAAQGAQLCDGIGTVTPTS